VAPGCSSCSQAKSDANWVTPNGTKIPTDWIDGIFDCTSTGDVFDTRSGTYPSIFGTHNGTITPYQDINVNTMYTYPCPGTGGHTEYVLIYNESGPVAEAHWHGYNGDCHNITFNTTKLLAHHTYNYNLFAQAHIRRYITRMSCPLMME